MDIINLNGEEYVKRSKIFDIEKERDKAQADLEAIKKIVGISLEESSDVLYDDLESKSTEVKISPKRTRRQPDAPFTPLKSAKKPFKILYMTQDGLFFTPNHKSLMITIKHVLQVQRFLHKNVTNREVDEFAKKLGFNYQIVHRVIWNYQQHYFDKFIKRWNKITQPVVDIQHKPIQNNLKKRKEASI